VKAMMVVNAQTAIVDTTTIVIRIILGSGFAYRDCRQNPKNERSFIEPAQKKTEHHTAAVIS
jgi:hypothetical protein